MSLIIGSELLEKFTINLTKIISNKGILNENESINIDKNICKNIIEDYIKKRKPIQWKPKLNDVNLIKYYLDNFIPYKTYHLFKYGKVQIICKYQNLIKIRKENNYREKPLDYDKFNNISFLKNEHVFKAIILDISLQFQEYFPNLNIDCNFEEKSIIESKWNKTGGLEYDSIITIKNNNDEVAQIGYNFDELSHRKNNEQDKRRDEISEAVFYHYSVCCEHFNKLEDNNKIIDFKKKYYKKFFLELVNNFFKVCCALDDNDELLAISSLSQKYINDEDYDNIIDNFVNYYKINNNKNLYLLAKTILKDPEEILEMDDYKIYFDKICECDNTIKCDCKNCNLEEELCKYYDECICNWKISNNIGEIVTLIDRDGSSQIKSLKKCYNDAAAELTNATKQINIMLRKILKNNHEAWPNVIKYIQSDKN